MTEKQKETLSNKLKIISSKGVQKYLEFFAFKSIVFNTRDSFADKLKPICEEVIVEINDKPLVVIDEPYECISQEDYVTIAQLTYDLEVFSSIPLEIIDRIKTENFKRFLLSTCLSLEENKWKVILSNRGYVGDLFSCKTNSFLSMEDLPAKKTIVINCGDEETVNQYYEKYKKTCRIETHRYLELIREWLIYEISRYFKKSLAQKGVSLYLVNWKWGHNHVLFPKSEITSVEKEERSKYSIYNITNNEKVYEGFLESLYGSDYSLQYVREVMDIPLRNHYAIGSIHHADHSSKYLNVFCGERNTCFQPTNAKNSVFLLGGCTFFGYAIDDSKTIASFLQKIINREINKPIKVCNYATWGGNIDQTYNTLYELSYQPGDVVVISYAGLIPVGDEIDKYDVSYDMGYGCNDQSFYFDSIMHCNAKGYENVANRLFDIIRADLAQNIEKNATSFRLEKKEEHKYHNSFYQPAIDHWLKSIKKELPPLKQVGKTYGSIVMNCNPFTLGHRYLIETAADQVDYLFVFVVQEDKSFFPFEDRYHLVFEGTKDLKNVYVLPSGSFMISAVTFPGYFLKDNPDHSDVDSSKDVEIFGRYIAPSLGISKRFVGEEPTDFVTRKYNETMQKILPAFGVELIIINRKRTHGSQGESVISASTVRKLLKDKDFQQLKCFVPESTYMYLRDKFG